MAAFRTLQILMIAGVVLLCSRTSAESAAARRAEPVILTECGQTAQSNEGVLQYKLEELYAADELCSFTIRTETTGNYLFTLESHGINGTSDPFALNIFTFGISGFLESTHLGSPNPLSQAYLSGGIAVIVFQTGSKSAGKGTGFRLSFQAVITNDRVGNYGVDYTFMTPNNYSGGGAETEMTLPFWDERKINKVNVIVLSPEAKAVQDVFSSLRVTFLKENLEKHITVADCGYDAIHLYSFTSQQLQSQGKFCSLTHHRAVYTTKGLMILVFVDYDESYWGPREATFKWGVVES